MASYSDGSQPITVIGIPEFNTISAASGSTQQLYWGRWVDWHLGSALALPFAILAHGVRWGWGLLFLLPLSLLAAGHFGSLLDTTDRTRKFLPYHIAFSALAFALTLVHLYTAVMYR